ncbi:MAG: ABC transporter substrate-binding protein, partial [Anaerolineae bacterium]
MTVSLTRRHFLHLAVLAGLGTIVISCRNNGTAPSEYASGTPIPTSFVSELTIFAGDYTPSSARTWGAVDTTKREALTKLASDWRDLHPNFMLKFVEAPSMVSLDTLLISQTMIETGPDIIAAPVGSLDKLAALGGTLPLNDYLASPNPYAPGSLESWATGYGAVFNASGSLHGGVPLDRTATGVYANLDMLEKAGIDLTASLNPITGTPESWAALIDWCVRLNKLGVQPFSMATSVLSNWLQDLLADQFFWRFTDKVDVLNYHQTEQKGRVTPEEIVMQIACNGWQPFNEPAMRAMFEFIKEFNTYLPEGSQTGVWMSYSWDDFLNGKLALLWDNCWLVRNLVEDENLAFKWAGFWLPPITSASSTYAHQPPIIPLDFSSFSTALGVNAASRKRGNLAECIDWLQFITTQERNAQVVNEVPMFLPAVRGAALHPDMTRLLGQRANDPPDARPTWPAPMYWLGQSPFTDTFQRAMSLYLLNEKSLDEFMAEASQAALTTLPEVVGRNAMQYNAVGVWDLTQWSCEPPHKT